MDKDNLSVSERVDAGIRLLATNGPADWRSRLDVSTLNVGSFISCPLAQIFGSFGLGLVELGIDYATTDDLIAHRYGFDGGDWDELNAEWTRRLTSDS